MAVYVWKTRKKVFARKFYFCSKEKRMDKLSSAKLLIINRSLTSLTLMMSGFTLTLTLTGTHASCSRLPALTLTFTLTLTLTQQSRAS
jgi:hypothetical protein